MNITLRTVTVREILENYVDNGELGVIGYNGKLNVRPPYQREFVYSEEKQKAVIGTVLSDFPLNVMYWSKIDNQDKYEILDGQQRTISLANFIVPTVGFSIKDPTDPHNPKYFHSLTQVEKEKIMGYILHIYICEGTPTEKTAWFKTINIASAVLTDQELRNAVYVGPWTAAAKKKFSGTNPPANLISKDYVDAKPLRQELLEVAIGWIVSKKSPEAISDYMALHQYDPDADELWQYFQSVVDWIKRTFPEIRKEIMRKVDWGKLFREHGNSKVNARLLEIKIKDLLLDEEVTNKAGIYSYVLDHNEKHLSIRDFSEKIKQEKFYQQNGLCLFCKKVFTYEQMEADHITPWSKGGTSIGNNCQMLCASCNANKSNKGNGISRIRSLTDL